MKNVLEYLEQSAKMYPDKIAVKDAACSYTYEQLQNKAKCIGACLAKQTTPRHPVCVFADKSADTLAVFLESSMRAASTHWLILRFRRHASSRCSRCYSRM